MGMVLWTLTNRARVLPSPGLPKGLKGDTMRFLKTKRLAAACAVGVVVGMATLSANHSWRNFHWARTNNPFTLKVGNNLSAGWSGYLDDAISAWNQSTVMDLTKVSGGTNSACAPTLGRLEVCNGSYGQNGWLGIASVWTSGSHIVQATTRVNDTYFNMSQYNSQAWRRLVMCQEIAHDFGLDHQDETFNNANLGSCMDYTNDPDGGSGGFSATDPSNEQPNQHDYSQLLKMYDHVDRTTTVGQPTSNPAAEHQIARGQFGRLVRSTNEGRTQLYVLDLGNGQQVWTHVIWADQ
jgi:hypothetical protein